MITGGVGWTAALNALQKQPLYVLSVPDLSLYLSTFVPTGLITGGSALIPEMYIPKGASQKIDELTGHSSISQMTVQATDTTNVLKAAAVSATSIGKYCEFLMGFPGMALADFVVIHAGRIGPIERMDNGVMAIPIVDLLQNLVSDVFLNGGPDDWETGQAKNPFPLFPSAVLDNGVPISEDNPRYLSGYPMNILLAVLQNELGIGQSAAPILVPGAGGSGTGMAGYSINPTWTFYDGADFGTLIYPNPYIDIDSIADLAAQFRSFRMEFTLTSSTNGKSWIENNILKPLGLYWIVKADGSLTLKSMKHPIVAPTATAISHDSIIGIPSIGRWPVINMIQATLPATATGSGGGQSGDSKTMAFVQQTSVAKYNNTYLHSVNADGFRLGLGGYGKMFLLANRIFNRHAFGTPEYKVKCFLKHFVLELGDFVSLTHSKLMDMVAGTIGVTSVLCEITDRQPDYANGWVVYKMIDTRFISRPRDNYVIADTDSAIPAWTGASGGQKAHYLFISDDSGHMSDLAAGNEIS